MQDHNNDKGSIMTLDTWLISISNWYEAKQYDQIEMLETLLYSAPNSVWGPTLTDDQSKAIACWLDSCLRVFEHTKYHNTNKAYQTLQYASAKLEVAAFNPATDIDIKDWCLKRLQHLTVLSLEFCNQQQDQSTWHEKAHSLIEIHVKLMASLSWNESLNSNNAPNLMPPH